MDNQEYLELCQKLYSLKPEWNKSSFWWHKYQVDTGWNRSYWREVIDFEKEATIPAYDLEWILGKLPKELPFPVSNSLCLSTTSGGMWEIEYEYACTEHIYPRIFKNGDTHTIASLKLLIMLVEKGIV